MPSSDESSARTRSRDRGPGRTSDPPVRTPPADLATATTLLSDWIRAVVPAITVAIASEADGGAMCLLREVVPVGPRADDEPGVRPPLTLTARYVLAARGRDAAAHDLLGRLAFAHLEGSPPLPVGTTDDETPPPPWWQAHGLPPLPALGLRVPIVRRRGDQPSPLVREPLLVRHIGVARCSGRLVSAAGEPIPGALVAASGMPDAVRTGEDGRFTLGVPADRPPGRVSVTLRRRTVSLAVPNSLSKPLILTFPD